eukprot:TRINITY_DN3911_c0_g1_i10.p1 TRINITY_DN3911_c0_g1~~TRINITY_DN3911_c0_g1_i10.p1  ORF type:complete len:308 (-),score=43.02 TRINITY_DN3911_c0_g1_i10:308-1186(-)
MTELSPTLLHLSYVLTQRKDLSVWSLMSFQHETLPVYNRALDELKAKNLIHVAESGKVSLTEEGEKHISRRVGPHDNYNCKCTACEGRGYHVNEQSKRVFEQFQSIIKGRPPPNEDYDQTAMSDADAVIRVGFFHQFGDLLNKELLMIGDFDCLSIAAALTRLPKRIVVLEIDTRLIEFINKVAREFQLPLEAHTWDVRQPLPDEYRGQFDLFSCDPVETIEGIKLYLSRGTQGLRGIGSAGYIGLTTLEAGKQKWYRIQKMLSQMGYIITSIHRNFNGYPVSCLCFSLLIR